MARQATMPAMKLLPLSILLLLCLLTSATQAETADFALKDTKGSTVHLSDFRGRWVVVNFWTTWCAPCVKEIPELIEFQRRHNKIQLLGVNFEQQTEQSLRPFLKRFELNYPQLLINDLPLIAFEPLKGLPTTAIIDPKGNLVSKHTGPITAVMLEEFFRKEGVLSK